MPLTSKCHMSDNGQRPGHSSQPAPVGLGLASRSQTALETSIHGKFVLLKLKF